MNIWWQPGGGFGAVFPPPPHVIPGTYLRHILVGLLHQQAVYLEQLILPPPQQCRLLTLTQQNHQYLHTLNALQLWTAFNPTMLIQPPGVE